MRRSRNPACSKPGTIAATRSPNSDATRKRLRAMTRCWRPVRKPATLDRPRTSLMRCRRRRRVASMIGWYVAAPVRRCARRSRQCAVRAQEFEGAANAYAEALAIDPDYPYARGNLVLAAPVLRLAIFDRGPTESAGLRQGRRIAAPSRRSPCPIRGREVRRICGAQTNIQRRPLWRGEVYRQNGKIRVAYLSADFNATPSPRSWPVSSNITTSTVRDDGHLAKRRDDRDAAASRTRFEHFIDAAGWASTRSPRLCGGWRSTLPSTSWALPVNAGAGFLPSGRHRSR